MSVTDSSQETGSGIPPRPYFDTGAGSVKAPPGEFPYTRGIYEEMYRRRLWTMRQYSGFGTAEESNRRYRYLLEQGGTGLSVALDLPTQCGYDSDDPEFGEEVGRVGVAVDTLADHYRGKPIHSIAAAEARGFLVASPLALQLKLPLIPLRKPGKLPYRTYALQYELEYGSAELQVHIDGQLQRFSRFRRFFVQGLAHHLPVAVDQFLPRAILAHEQRVVLKLDAGLADHVAGVVELEAGLVQHVFTHFTDIADQVRHEAFARI